MTTHTQPPDTGDPSDHLVTLLGNLYHHGAQPEALVKHARELLAVVAPARPGEAAFDQAVRTHGVIVAAARGTRPPPAAEALRILLCLDPPARGPGWVVPTLTTRRDRVAALYGVQPGTWRKRYEDHLTVAFAMAVYSRLPRPPGTRPTRRHGQPADPTFPLPDTGTPDHPPRPAASFQPRHPPPGSFRPRGPTQF